MNEIILVGIGCGNDELLTEAARNAIERADMIIGADRMLDSVISKGKKCSAIKVGDIVKLIEENQDDRICVVYSGDTGFYSGATGLAEELRKRKIGYRIIPGISSIQILSARLGQPWQDWKLVSAHGRNCNIMGCLMEGKDTFFLTGGSVLPKDVCRQLCEAGLGKTEVVVGERLTYEDEKITVARAEELLTSEFDTLAVMLVKAIEVPENRMIGIDDDSFVRGKVPMTKRDVRASIMARLNISKEDVVWDVGAGTGSVSVELAMAAHAGKVYAIECNSDGCDLIAENRNKFKVWNLNIVKGRAPEVLEGLPKPDAVFIGGTRGDLGRILDKVVAENPSARICITAIALESLTNSLSELTSRGFEINVTQIAASRSKKIGSYNMLNGENPIFIITGGCDA